MALGEKQGFKKLEKFLERLTAIEIVSRERGTTLQLKGHAGYLAHFSTRDIRNSCMLGAILCIPVPSVLWHSAPNLHGLALSIISKDLWMGFSLLPDCAGLDA